MRLIALLVLFFSLTSCYRPIDEGEREEYPDIPALESVVVTYSDELERYKRLFLTDSRAFFDHYVEFVWMKLRTQEIMEVYEARDLLVYIVEGFLARVNEDPQVSYDLSEFPFTAKNLIIEIEFDSFYQYLNPRTIGRIHMHDGDIHYYASDALDPDTAWFHLRCEPYEKALRFSKYKHYRPWLKVPEKAAGEFRDLDLSGAGKSGKETTLMTAPPVRPPKREREVLNDITSNQSTGRKSTSSAFPSSSVKSYSQ